MILPTTFGPNVKGKDTLLLVDVTYSSTGALKLTDRANFQWAFTSVSGGVGRNSLELDASLSNSVYTDSGKVYPASLALNFIIKT